MLARGAQLLEEHLVRIVTGGVEEQAAIEVGEGIVIGHERVQAVEVIGGEVAVARHDQQMALRAERLAAHALAELVVDLKLPLAHDKASDLRHARTLGH